MPAELDPQLLKGVLSLLLLHLLAEQESYGYELVKRLHDLGLPDVLEGSVYPALSRLEREQRITSRLIASTAGPARKYYRPTSDGYAALEDGARRYQVLTDAVSRQLARPVPATPQEGNPS
ncbi:MAG: PadR family transcriptional regulator, regulatory protein PadR [Actinomycetota bacterium]|jgi:PadR family transcriptional regulator PadR|nr:PadR family transcriptional regulator, regulatory protein PadR [Actinomycetota bacterium]